MGGFHSELIFCGAGGKQDESKPEHFHTDHR